jgi:hypothetical protein
MEQIKLMEKRMEALKQENAKKLVEANEVLSYLSRDPKKDIRSEDDRTESTRLNDLSHPGSQVSVVDRCQTPEEHSNNEIDDKALIANDEDLVPGSPCGSEFSSVVPMTSSGSHYRRQTVLSTKKSETDDLTHRDESGSASSSSTEKPVHNRLKMINLSETATLGASPVEDALNINTEQQMLEEIATLRQDLSMLKRQMVGLHHGQSSHETHIKQEYAHASSYGQRLSSTITRLRRAFRQMPRPGTQRLEWICVSVLLVFLTISLQFPGMRRELVC